MAVLDPDPKESGDKNRIKQENESPRGERPEQPAFTNTLEGGMPLITACRGLRKMRLS